MPFQVPCRVPRSPVGSSLLAAPVGDSQGRCPSGTRGDAVLQALVLGARFWPLALLDSCLIAVTELIGCDPQGGAAPGRQQTAIENIFLSEIPFYFVPFGGRRAQGPPYSVADAVGVVSQGEPAASGIQPPRASPRRVQLCGRAATPRAGPGATTAPGLRLPRGMPAEGMLQPALLGAVWGKSSFACLCKEALSGSCKVQTFYRSLKIF